MLGRNMLSMSGLSLYRNAIQFGMNIAVTAFIPPAEYGLVVFTTPFVVLIAMLTDLGLASAIARSPRLTREEAGAALTGTAALGLAFALALAIVARPLEARLAMPGLHAVMIGMAVSVVLGITASVPRALLERRLAFGRIAAIEAIAVLAGAAIGLFAAWHGAGALALVWYNIVNHAIRATSFLWLARGDVSPNLRWGRLGALLSFGTWVLAANLLSFLQRNSDNLLIGASLGAAAVGVYGLAYQFMLAPVMAITWPTSAILLASLRDTDLHGDRARRTIESVIAATGTLSIPAMAYLTFGIAWPIHALLSERWHDVPLIIAWLAPLGALQSIASYNGVVLMVGGRARAQFVYTAISTAVLVATFVLALPFGLLAFVQAYVLASTLLSLAYLRVIVRAMGTSWRRTFGHLLPAMIGTAGGLAAVRLVDAVAPAGGWAHWIAATAAYAAVVLGTYALMRSTLRAGLSFLVSRTPAPAV